MAHVLNGHIEVTPGVCGGRPRIRGHRIRVQDVVVWHEKLGMSPDEIVTAYPQITLGDVYAALAYYHDHLAEIQQQVRDDDELVIRMRASSVSKLAQHVTQRDAG